MMFERVTFWNTKRQQVTGTAIAVTQATPGSWTSASTCFVIRRDDGDYAVIPVDHCTHCTDVVGAMCGGATQAITGG